MKGGFNCRRGYRGQCSSTISSAPVAKIFVRLLNTGLKTRVCKNDGKEGLWGQLLSKQPDRDCEYSSRKGVLPSSVGKEKESWNELTRNRQQESEKEREEGENDRRHSFTTVSAFWTVVSDSSSIMWRWILDHWFSYRLRFSFFYHSFPFTDWVSPHFTHALLVYSFVRPRLVLFLLIPFFVSRRYWCYFPRSERHAWLEKLDKSW